MIELKNICKVYKMGETEVHALKNVSLKIHPGEFVAIMGSSGSGKSTLLHILGFLDRPDSGQYMLNNENVAGLNDDELSDLRNRVAGFVFQQFHLLPQLTAMENVELPLVYSLNKGLKIKAHRKLNAVGLKGRAKHKPNELSGGQQQRVAIARSLVNEPMIIFADEPTGNLDTKSEEEIIDILSKLNGEGKTIIMVTHDQEVADKARRVIQMRDGEIISDSIRSATLDKKHFNRNLQSFSLGAKRISFVAMEELIDNFRQGFHSIFSKKMRSCLSLLGILIGVASVIAMLALGTGAQESMNKTFSSLGTNILSIRSGARRMGGVSLQAGSLTRLTLQDAEEISQIDKVVGVSPLVRGRVQAVYGNENWNTQVKGVGLDYEIVKSSSPIAGRFFTEEEVKSRKKVCLIGLTLVKELFDGSNPIGETIKIDRRNFRIIGVLPEKGSDPRGDQDDVIVMPITTAMYRVLGSDYVENIEAQIMSVDVMDQVAEEIETLLVKRHRNSSSESFEVRNMADMVNALTSMTKTMTILLGFVSAISLFVGGIGIMNIMLVSVTERTREIGLRKAIGARKYDIMIQFLIESVLLTSLGGILGIILGSGASLLLSIITGWSTKVTMFSVLLATGFSVAVGLGFGLWPARKAAELNPIEALRYE